MQSSWNMWSQLFPEDQLIRSPTMNSFKHTAHSGEIVRRSSVSTAAGDPMKLFETSTGALLPGKGSCNRRMVVSSSFSSILVVLVNVVSAISVCSFSVSLSRPSSTSSRKLLSWGLESVISISTVPLLPSVLIFFPAVARSAYAQSSSSTTDTKSVSSIVFHKIFQCIQS